MSELQGLQSRLDEVRDLNGRVVAVSTGSVADNQKLAESAGITFALLSDPQLDAIDAFGLRHPGASVDGSDIARPAVFIIAPDGQIAWRRLTDNWRVRVRPDQLVQTLKDL